MKVTEWGTMQIWGPRHSFREGLLYGAFQRKVNTGRVLDAGCGSGSMVLKLLLDGYDVDGIEDSRKFVDMVKVMVQSLKTDRKVDIKKGSTTDIPYADETFDGVISSEVLEHVDNDSKAVKELWRVLKKRGICAVSVPANPDLWDKSDEWAGHKRRYTKEGLISLFEGNGFKIEEIFFWGFPLVRLYNRLFFLNYIKRGGMQEGDSSLVTKSSLNRVLSVVLSFIFRFDNLFNRLPFGIGIVLVASKL